MTITEERPLEPFDVLDVYLDDLEEPLALADEAADPEASWVFVGWSYVL